MNSPLTVAIVHHHLKPGGVTRVIENAVRSLHATNTHAATISGELYRGQIIKKTAVVEGLQYGKTSTPEKLAQNLKEAAQDALGKPPDIWHFHNHSLGKNPALTQAVSILAKNAHVLLQIHDFAEDGRPELYETLTRTLSSIDLAYPVAPQIHYATINLRDHKILQKTGLPKTNCHYLPNAVSIPQTTNTTPPPFFPNQRLFLYPTRAIARKNIGEFLLWAALSENEEDLFAITLAPENPREKPLYHSWIELTKELKLPVLFELSKKSQYPLPDLIKEAYSCITTSTKEGFGLAYLEPYFYQKPVTGRDLPSITEDFKAHNINLSNTYSRLDIPFELLDNPDQLKTTIKENVISLFSSYQKTPSEAFIEKTYQSLIQNEKIDFGKLTPALQFEVIKKIVKSPETQKYIKQTLKTISHESIQKNQEIINKHYSTQHYCQMLTTCYQKILNYPISTVNHLTSNTLLNEFLSPENIQLIRN